MMKATVKKMILTAAMAAFMVSAPAMAEEADLIIEESFEATEETAVEEAQAIEIEVLGLETIATAEVPTEAAQEAEAAVTEANAVAETEENTEAQSFTYENDEVIISAQAAAELPENIEMQVRKLEEGSEEYEAAKAATGAGEDAQYSFYDVTFTADGAEVELAEGSVYVQVEFKTVQINSEETQGIYHIDENGANNVTAETEEGSNMSSVNFAM